MEKKTTWVQMKDDDHNYKEWKKDECGYIDGWIRGGDERPYAAIVIGDRIVLAMANQVKVIYPTEIQ